MSSRQAASSIVASVVAPVAIKKRRGPRVGEVALYTALVVSSIVMLLPFYWMVNTGLMDETGVMQYPPQLIANPVRLDNFVTALTVRPFGRWFANTIFVAGSVTVLQLVTCSLAAYAFARLRFPGRDKLFLLYLGTLMIPGQVTLIPTFILMRVFGWLDSYQALILPPAFSAFGTFLLRQFFLTIPFELEDAAKIDGASRFQSYARIIIPLAGPALAALTIFAFLQQWNSFLWPLVIINALDMKTITVGLRAFQGTFGTQYQLMMAAATVSLLPVLAVFVAAQRYFVAGITFTGMGGR